MEQRGADHLSKLLTYSCALSIMSGITCYANAAGPAPLLAPVAPMMPAAAPMAPAGNATAGCSQSQGGHGGSGWFRVRVDTVRGGNCTLHSCMPAFLHAVYACTLTLPLQISHPPRIPLMPSLYLPMSSVSPHYSPLFPARDDLISSLRSFLCLRRNHMAQYVTCPTSGILNVILQF